MDITFIIPAYNASDVISRSIDSILSVDSERLEFEIIVVDDCSSDDTCTVVEKYIEKFSNIRLLRQTKNHRQGAARNKALIEARGIYVMYVDADDEIGEGVVDAIYYTKENDLDICYCNAERQNAFGVWYTQSVPIPQKQIMSGSQLLEKYTDDVLLSPWLYIWKREYLIDNNEFFIVDHRYEDPDYVDKNVIKAQRLAFLDVNIYRYFNNISSTVNTCSNDTIGDHVLCAYRRMMYNDEVQEEHPEFAKRRNEQCCVWINGDLSLRRISRLPIKEIPLLYQRISIANTYLKHKKGIRGYAKLSVNNPRLAASMAIIATPFLLLLRKVYRKIK